MSFGSIVKTVRVQLQLSQKQLARELNIIFRQLTVGKMAKLTLAKWKKNYSNNFA